MTHRLHSLHGGEEDNGNEVVNAKSYVSKLGCILFALIMTFGALSIVEIVGGEAMTTTEAKKFRTALEGKGFPLSKEELTYVLDSLRMHQYVKTDDIMDALRMVEKDSLSLPQMDSVVERVSCPRYVVDSLVKKSVIHQRPPLSWIADDDTVQVARYRIRDIDDDGDTAE